VKIRKICFTAVKDKFLQWKYGQWKYAFKFINISQYLISKCIINSFIIPRNSFIRVFPRITRSHKTISTPVFMFRVFSLADEKTAIRRGYMSLLSRLLLFISQWNWQLLTEVGFTHWNKRATSKWKLRIEINQTNINCYNNLYQNLMIASLMVVDY
jgi:hypothetical protein